jgi:hypothetical protein
MGTFPQNSLGNPEVADSEREAALMNRFSFAISILGLALISLNAPGQTSIPVDHKEPITVHIVDGQDGHPIAHLHLALVAGYDHRDLEQHLWLENAMTDEHGDIHLPSTLLNLPWLRVSMPKSSMCKADPRAETFSVERMRNDGLSSSNRCGTVTVGERPGVFTLFAQERKTAHASRDASLITAMAYNAKESETKLP